MAHFARLDVNDMVIRVHVVNNDVITINGKEDEQMGVKFLADLYNGGWYKQTSYNNKFRKNYAGIGYTYDKARDAFIAPKPYPSWLLDADTCQWNAPTAMPDDEKPYDWDEDTTSWKEIE